MKNVKTLYILLQIIIFSSCDKELMVDTSAKADFDLFFEYLENDYAYRDAYPFSMEHLKQKYLQQIEASNTHITLATVLVNIENELKDPHLYFNEDDIYNLSNVPKYTFDSLEEKIPLFNEVTIDEDTPYYTYGTISLNPNIGYIYIRAFNDGIGGTDSLDIEDGVQEIDNIIQELNNKGITSMIVDMRSSAGGSNYVPRYIAQRFIDKTATYMTEYYPEGKSFIKKEWKIQPEGTGFRSGKIALLSNGQTASGGEMFLLGMLQRDNVIHIGSNSVGAAGNIVDKDLSNGWNFTLTNSKTEYPNGKQYFKVGITPSIIIKNSTDYGTTNFNDKLIEKAIEELQ